MGIFKKKRKAKDGTDIIEYNKVKGKKGKVAKTKYIEEIQNYFDQQFPNREELVFHEIISEIVHIDLHIMYPKNEEDFYVVYTTGMSDLPMNIPKELKNEYSHLQRSELVAFLPSSWVLEMENPSDWHENDYWIFRMLKFIAKFPHEYKTWVSSYHTIPNGADYDPYSENSDFSCIILLPRDVIQTKDGKHITILDLEPIYKEEAQYKLNEGSEKFMEKLDKVYDNKEIRVLNINRKNFAKDECKDS